MSINQVRSFHEAKNFPDLLTDKGKKELSEIKDLTRAGACFLVLSVVAGAIFVSLGVSLSLKYPGYFGNFSRSYKFWKGMIYSSVFFIGGTTAIAYSHYSMHRKLSDEKRQQFFNCELQTLTLPSHATTDPLITTQDF